MEFLFLHVKTQEMLEARIKKLEQEKEDSLALLRRELIEIETNKSEELKLLKQQHQSEVQIGSVLFDLLSLRHHFSSFNFFKLNHNTCVKN